MRKEHIFHLLPVENQNQRLACTSLNNLINNCGLNVYLLLFFFQVLWETGNMFLEYTCNTWIKVTKVVILNVVQMLYV